MFSSSLALALIVCLYYFFFCLRLCLVSSSRPHNPTNDRRLCLPFRCVYPLSDLSSFSFVYIPFSTFCSPNPVLSYLHPFTELLIERTVSPLSTPFLSLRIHVWTLTRKKSAETLDRLASSLGCLWPDVYIYTLCTVGRFLDIPYLMSGVSHCNNDLAGPVS